MSTETRTRPLTAKDLRTTAIALSTAIGRDGDKLARSSHDLAYIYVRLRTAAEALAAITDHVCDNHVYRDGDEEEPATHAPPA